MINNKNKICYQVDHFTEIEYDFFVIENSFLLTMEPIEREYQKIHNYQLTIEPQAPTTAYKDSYGNNKICFNILENHNRVQIHSSFKVEITHKANLNISDDKTLWEDLKSLDMWDWLKDSFFAKNSQQLNEFLIQEGIEKKETPLSSLKFLNSKLHELFEYKPQATHAQSFIEEILKNKKGVCQDYTHVMISIARLWGIPARYVSGYLYQEKEGDMDSLSDQTHAWCECYLPSLGWLAFDPTNNMLAEEQHIITAIGRDYKDIPPHYGFFKGAQQTKQMNVKVYIKKIDEINGNE